MHWKSFIARGIPPPPQCLNKRVGIDPAEERHKWWAIQDAWLTTFEYPSPSRATANGSSKVQRDWGISLRSFSGMQPFRVLLVEPQYGL